VYATGVTRRLTPHEIADFSFAVSPSGVNTVVTSYGERGWSGEVEELSTNIYLFLTRDGTNWVKVVEHGGWPSWVDELVIVERVTPPGLHAFTPATSPGNKKFIAVATRRWRARQLQKKNKARSQSGLPESTGFHRVKSLTVFYLNPAWLQVRVGRVPGSGSTCRAGPGFKTMPRTSNLGLWSIDGSSSPVPSPYHISFLV
jgi:hypothetical protein